MTWRQWCKYRNNRGIKRVLKMTCALLPTLFILTYLISITTSGEEVVEGRVIGISYYYEFMSYRVDESDSKSQFFSKFCKKQECVIVLVDGNTYDFYSYEIYNNLAKYKDHSYKFNMQTKSSRIGFKTKIISSLEE